MFNNLKFRKKKYITFLCCIKLDSQEKKRNIQIHIYIHLQLKYLGKNNKKPQAFTWKTKIESKIC